MIINCYVVSRKYHKGLGLIFSLLYCHTVWSTIGIILSSVRSSATLCIVAFRWFRVGVQDQKLCTSVSIAANFLFVPSDTFAVGSFSHKTHRNKRVQENANVSCFDFWDTENQAWSGLACTVENLRRSTSQTLLVTLWWIEFGCFHKM